MTVVYHEEDAHLHHLYRREIALIGYNRMGRALAMNLRDSGVNLVIGNQEDSYAERARQDGFQVISVAEAAQRSDMMFMALSEEAMPAIYLESVAPYLRTGDMLLFASAYNLAFGFIEPPAYVDAGLIAPRTLAVGVRDGYLTGLGYPCYVAVAQDGSGQTWDNLLALARALGALKQGAIEIPFNQEIELDLFWQQAVFPAIHSILLSAMQILLREGYPPEIALNELYLSGKTGMLFSRAALTGFSSTLELLPMTGQYSVLSRTERFQDAKMQRQMESILHQIREGYFSQEWAAEYADGYPRLETLRERMSASSLWRYEDLSLEILRGLLPPDDDEPLF